MNDTVKQIKLNGQFPQFSWWRNKLGTRKFCIINVWRCKEKRELELLEVETTWPITYSEDKMLELVEKGDLVYIELKK